jgi:hypothetical protein
VVTVVVPVVNGPAAKKYWRSTTRMATVSREEILEKYDKDGDGELNEEERAALREDMGGRKGKGKDDHGGPQGE